MVILTRFVNEHLKNVCEKSYSTEYMHQSLYQVWYLLTATLRILVMAMKFKTSHDPLYAPFLLLPSFACDRPLDMTQEERSK